MAIGKHWPSLGKRRVLGGKRRASFAFTRGYLFLNYVFSSIIVLFEAGLKLFLIASGQFFLSEADLCTWFLRVQNVVVACYFGYLEPQTRESLVQKAFTESSLAPSE